MNRLATRSILVSSLLLLVAGSAPAADRPHLSLGDALSALDLEFELPAAWAGVWEVTDDQRDCETMTLIDSDTSADTLCAGDSYDLGAEDVEIEFDCTGSVTDDRVDIECSGTSIDEGCTTTFNLDLEADRSGDTFSGLNIIAFDISGEGCAFPFSSCVRIESTGTRIGPQPEECTVPVEAVRWSTVKSRYR